MVERHDVLALDFGDRVRAKLGQHKKLNRTLILESGAGLSMGGDEFGEEIYTKVGDLVSYFRGPLLLNSPADQWTAAPRTPLRHFVRPAALRRTR